ncbi:unnamed protein product [Musa banksii]
MLDNYRESDRISDSCPVSGSSDTRKANGCSSAHQRLVAALGAFHLSSSSSGKSAEGRWGRFQFEEACKSGRVGTGERCHWSGRSEQGSEVGNMGSVSSCLLEEDTEEYQHSSASVFRSCICVRCLAQQLISVYTALFSREEVHAAPSSLRERVLVASPSLNINDSIPDTYNAPPRPVPYDDPIFSQRQHDGLISRHDKILSHFHEESEPFINNNDNEAELKTEGKCKSIFDGGYKFGQPESSLKRFSAEPRKEIMNNFPYEDEDVCPTCLEDYTSEDPKITMQCSHHFHLGCIYEWMERSDACPVCGKMMVFKEAT